MKKLLPLIALSVLSTTYASARTVEERLDDLELTRDLTWIKWGGSLETRYDYIDNERKKEYDTLNTATGSNETNKKGSTNDRYYRMWANLNMEAAPSDRLTFFGRLSASKYFSVLGSQGQPSNAFADLSEGQSQRGSQIYLERAFANYAINKQWTFTMGRLPTIDGPNKHVALNQQLSGNYPTLGYSAILDGFALTRTSKLDDGAVFRGKIIYTPLQNVNYQGTNRLEDFDGNKIDTVSDYASLILEYEKSNGSFFRKNLTMFQWLHGDTAPFYLGRVDRRVDTDNDDVPDQDLALGSDLEVGVDRLVIYSEYEGLFNTGFDFAYQVMYSQTKSRGDLFKCTDSLGGAICNNAGYGGAQGWNTNKKKDTMSGTAVALTTRYQLPIPSMNRPKIGLEYFTATRQAYVYDSANVNPINMYATSAGQVYHLFWNQSFDGGLFLNAGYMHRQQNRVRQAFGIFGDDAKVKNTDQNVYVSLLATF